MLKYINHGKKYEFNDVEVDLGTGHPYSETGLLNFRVWTNTNYDIRCQAYTTVILTPSYRVTERETVQGVAKAAVKDLARLVDIGICEAEKMLVLCADGTHKDKTTSSAAGPWFLDAQLDPDILVLVEKYKIDFATLVTEDSDIFSSIPGKTDVRGKGTQFEASFNFIQHYAMSKDEDNGVVLCIDSDLKGTDGFVCRMCHGLNQGYSYLVPFYWRYKYEGRLTNHLMFPLYAAITGNVVRQPIGGEFAFDLGMLKRFTNNGRWPESWRNFGVDIGMTIKAGTSGENIGQVVLPRKINYVGADARAQIGGMFVQSGSSLFKSLSDLVKSQNGIRVNEMMLTPIVESEQVNSENTKIEISDVSEVLSALNNFLILYNSPAFQNDRKRVLGRLSEVVQNSYEGIKKHGLCKYLEKRNLRKLAKDEQNEIFEAVRNLNYSVLLTESQWGEIVFKCFEEFQVLCTKNEELATKVVVSNVLLCVFYLRVFSFNVQVYNLPTYPDAEEIIHNQMYVFTQLASTRGY